MTSMYTHSKDDNNTGKTLEKEAMRTLIPVPEAAIQEADTTKIEGMATKDQCGRIETECRVIKKLTITNNPVPTTPKVNPTTCKMVDTEEVEATEAVFKEDTMKTTTTSPGPRTGTPSTMDTDQEVMLQDATMTRIQFTKESPFQTDSMKTMRSLCTSTTGEVVVAEVADTSTMTERTIDKRGQTTKIKLLMKERPNIEEELYVVIVEVITEVVVDSIKATVPIDMAQVV